MTEMRTHDQDYRLPRLEETETIHLSVESSTFVQGLLSDVKVLPAMRKAKQRHDLLISNG